MTAVHWPWSHLEIAPTEDRKTIREAYSRLLKALDHETEAEAYMDLRHARDAALSGQFLHPPSSDDGEEQDDFGLGSPLPEGAVLADQAPTQPAPEEKAVFNVEYNDDDDKRFQRMVDLFLGEGELTMAESEELNQHLDALFADERMGDLGHYARVESWLAQLLVDRYPRGSELFLRVAEYFHWADRAHELGIHPAIPWLFHAHEGVSLVREIETPGHAYHREWLELKRGNPGGTLWFRAVDKPRMANLIATIRRDYPWLEGEHWQPALVERWEKKSADGGIRGPRPLTWLWLILFASLMISRLTDRDPSQTHNNVVLASAAADRNITDFIDDFPDAATDGRTIVTLRVKSPKLYETLQRTADVPEALTEQRRRAMMRDVAETYYRIIDKLPYAIQVADAEFRAVEIKHLRDTPQGCAEFVRDPGVFLRQDRNIDDVSLDYRYRMFSVVYDEYGDREWPLVHKDFSVPGDIVGKLIARSGLSEDRLRAVFQSRTAPDADVCRAMGSFYELLTEIPAKEASEILPAVL